MFHADRQTDINNEANSLQTILQLNKTTEVRHAIIVRGEILNSNNIFKSEVTLKDIVLPVYWVMVYGRLIKNVVNSLTEVSDRRF